MTIYSDLILRGALNTIKARAVIDTGAERSMLPLWMANNIGAWPTHDQTNVMGIHRDVRRLQLIVAGLYFPHLNPSGGLFTFVMSDVQPEPIIGMDILNRLGIDIDTKTGQLSVKNEFWEAFKTLTAASVICVGAMKFLDTLLEQNY